MDFKVFRIGWSSPFPLPLFSPFVQFFSRVDCPAKSWAPDDLRFEDLEKKLLHFSFPSFPPPPFSLLSRNFFLSFACPGLAKGNDTFRGVEKKMLENSTKRSIKREPLRDLPLFPSFFFLIRFPLSLFLFCVGQAFSMNFIREKKK